MRVTVCHSPGPRQVREDVLELADGTTASAALLAAGLVLRQEDTVGIWGRRVDPSQVLRDGDRLEVVRPLQVDPKVARRERFRRQGSRATGLFAGRRPGAKPGY